MQWHEFQDTAARLTQGRTEGDWRSAISRSYYAVFHFFREFLLSHGVNIGRGAQSHFNLYVGLLHCGFGPVADIGRRIDSLRVSRRDADYDLAQSIAQPFAQANVQETNAVIVDFQTLWTTLPAATIAGGVRSHLRLIGRLGPTP